MDLPATQLAPNPFAYNEIVLKVALSAGIGLLVGFEREWAQKEIGVRTFASAGLLGMLTSLLAPSLVVGALAGVLLLIAFLNIHSLLKDRSLELTTSMCLIVVFFLGTLVGLGHNFTAGTAAIAMMMLLAWKPELERFAGALRPEEIRSAVLLGLLGVVIYPLLPDRYVDPWELINPRQYWITVLVIAGLGFVNYVLLRLYGARGLFYAAALGGLVNSTAAASELAASFRGKAQHASRALSVLLITNISMFLRNGLILAIFAASALYSAIGPLAAMVLTCAAIAFLRTTGTERPTEPLQLASPVSFRRVVKFSLLFLVLACAGTLAQKFLGSSGFLIVSVAGGFVSSASTTATAAALVAEGKVDPFTGGVAAVLTSMTSALATTPLVYQQTADRRLATSLTLSTLLAIALGIAALLGTYLLLR